MVRFRLDFSGIEIYNVSVKIPITLPECSKKQRAGV